MDGNSDHRSPALSPQQRRFSTGQFSLYRELVAGDASLVRFLGFEFYTLLFSGLPGLLGYGARTVALPLFVRAARGRPAIGRGVTIRQPHRISFGRSVIVDDYAVLDIRADSDAPVDSGIELGDHVLVGRNSLLVAKNGTIRLAPGVNISSACRIATQSLVEIGESVLIAAFSYIGPGNHRIDDPHRPLIEQGMDIRGGVKIGAHSWIGAHSTILDGVTLGSGVIVGAHSLVRSSFPDNSIVAGVPAKLIGTRSVSAESESKSVGE